MKGHHSRLERRDRRVVRLEDFTDDEMALVALDMRAARTRTLMRS